MADSINLTHQFLIAMPNMVDAIFAGTVVYVCEHNERGALGLVINRPTDLNLQTLFERIELSLDIEPLAAQPVLFGGPVQADRGFVLHEAMGSYMSSLMITDKLEMTTSKDVLEAIGQGQGPKRLLVTLGYAGWSAGQVEEEIANNGWLTVEADERIIFDVPIEERFNAAIRLLGFDPAMLSGEAGHA
ncbi:YqgE/AlgH family protein [Ampullimonas aquatilis]|uniref:YqgE/AlgH family protein n=1 Tax=Ampullimonas aquatilis TaxID=1341549 RepID=UPI003C785F6D